MKRFNLHIGAFLTLALAVSSCAEEELVKDYFVPSPSNTITFGASDLQVEVLSRSGKSNNDILSTTESKLVSEDGQYSLPMLVQVQEGIHRIGEAAPASRGNKMQNIGDITTLHAWATHNATSLYINGTAGDVFTETSNIYSPATEGIHYMWPSDGTLDFMTVANKPAAFTPNFNDANTEIVSFNYTVPANAADQPDILIAQASASADAGEGENPFGVSVPLDFKHIMAAVNFRVGTITEVSGTIKSITLKGVYNQGTYNVSNHEWVERKINDGGTFSVPLNDAKTASATTLMMIPQQPLTGAEVEIVFSENNNGTIKDIPLRASIQGDNWRINTTTNYLINIDGSYNLQIVPLDKVIDSHYVITKVEVTSQYPWNLKAVSDDGALVTVQLESQVNSLAKKGFWTDKKVKKINGTYVVDENTTARGNDTFDENVPAGTYIVYVFIPENISGKDRTITLTATDTNDTEKALELTQSSVQWLQTKDGVWGCELLIEGGQINWGFCWEGLTATYVLKQGGGDNSYNSTTDSYSPSQIPAGQDKKIKPAMELAGIDVDKLNDPNYYINVAPGGGKFTYYIIIKLDKVGNVGVGKYEGDGWQNTYDIYHFEGISSLSQLIDFCNTWGDGSTLTNPDGRATKIQESLDYAAMYAMKRNRFYYYEEFITQAQHTMVVPVIFTDDIDWYLPAKEQFNTLIEMNANWGQEFSLYDSYWTSTAYLTETEATNAHSYAYINGIETIAHRNNPYLTMALRLKEQQ